MDPGLENAKMLMAQANKPMIILKNTTLRLFKRKAFVFFKFIWIYYSNSKVQKLRGVSLLVIIPSH